MYNTNLYLGFLFLFLMPLIITGVAMNFKVASKLRRVFFIASVVIFCGGMCGRIALAQIAIRFPQEFLHPSNRDNEVLFFWFIVVGLIGMFFSMPPVRIRY